MMNMKKLPISEEVDRGELFGSLDSHLKIVEEHFGVNIIQRDNELVFQGEKIEPASQVVEEMVSIVAKGEKLDTQKINYVIALNENGISYKESKINKDIIGGVVLSYDGHVIDGSIKSQL